MSVSSWKTATIALNGTTSGAVDLGGNYKELVVLIPALDSATVTVHVSEDNSTFFAVHDFDADATGSFAHATSADTAAKTAIFHIGGVQFIKVVAGAAQTSLARTFRVRGC